jgi:peptidoglycan/xylan/chitin deacetylase (PgdA/CDA1 family)
MLARHPHLLSLDPNAGSLPERLTNMASRFIARQSRNKVLPLGDAGPLVTFTFDDVPASACEAGARVLERHGARATFYVAGQDCGAAGSGGSPRASIEQLRTVWADGHEIGCHTYSHPAIRYMSLAELSVELERNRAALKAIDRDIELRNFAYPYGDLSVRDKRYLEGCFDSCRSGHAGINSGVADLGALHAWPLQEGPLSKVKIAELIAETVRRRGWLIFFGHDVVEQPGTYGISPDLLEFSVTTAQRAGCVVTTVADGLDRIRRRVREP